MEQSRKYMYEEEKFNRKTLFQMFIILFTDTDIALSGSFYDSTSEEAYFRDIGLEIIGICASRGNIEFARGIAQKLVYFWTMAVDQGKIFNRDLFGRILPIIYSLIDLECQFLILLTRLFSWVEICWDSLLVSRSLCGKKMT